MAIQTYSDPFSQAEDLAAMYDEERADNEDTGAFMGGIESGAYGLRSSFNNALAAGGRAIGADGFAEGRERAADELSQRAAGAGHMLPGFDEIDSVGQAADWTTGLIGANIPLLLGMAGAGVVGRGAGSAAMGRRGLARAVGDSAAQKELNRLALNGMRDVDAIHTARAAGQAAELQAGKRSMLRNAAGQALTGHKGAVAQRVGQTAGVAAPYFGATTGETYNTLRNDEDATGTLQDRGQAALLAGAGQTALGMVFEPLSAVQRLQRFSKANQIARAQGKTPKALGPMAALGITSVGEGATEAGEQAIQQFTHQQFNDEIGYDGMELLESAIGGAIIGGAFAAPSTAAALYDKHLGGNTDAGVPNAGEPQAVQAFLQDVDQNIQAISLAEASGKANDAMLNEKAQLLAQQAAVIVQNTDMLGASVEQIAGLRDQLSKEHEALGVAPTDQPQRQAPWLARKAMIEKADSLLSRKQVLMGGAPEVIAPQLYEAEEARSLGEIAQTLLDSGRPIPEELATKLQGARADAAKAEGFAGVAEKLVAIGRQVPPKLTEALASMKSAISGVVRKPTETAEVTAAKEEIAALEDMARTLRADGKRVPIKITATLRELRAKTTAHANTDTGEDGSINYEDGPTQHTEGGPPPSSKDADDPASYEVEEGSPPLEGKKAAPDEYAGREYTLENSSEAEYIAHNIPGDATFAEREMFARQLEKVEKDHERDQGLLDMFDAGWVLTPDEQHTRDNIRQAMETRELSRAHALEQAKLGRDYKAPMPQTTEGAEVTNQSNASYSDPSEYGAPASDSNYTSSVSPEQSVAELSNLFAINTKVADDDGVEVPSQRYIPGQSSTPGYTSITDNSPGNRQTEAVLEVPEDILTGLIEKKPIKFNGESIPRGALTALFAKALRDGNAPTADEVFEVARYAHEMRRSDVQKDGIHVFYDKDAKEVMVGDVEVKTVAVRPTPLQAEFEIFGVKVSTDRAQDFDEGKNAMIDAQAKRGNLLVGSMDNNLYFATPEKAVEFYEAIQIDKDVDSDLGLIERAGTILKKQSGARTFLDLDFFAHHSGDKEYFHSGDDHDGLVVRNRGVRLAQGVTTRKIIDPTTGKVKYEINKGMMRSLLRDIGFRPDEEGRIARTWDTFDSRGRYKRDGERREEKPSLGMDLQFKKKLTRNSLEFSQELQADRLFPAAESKGGNANLQQILFSFLDPAGFMARDRHENFPDADPGRWIPKGESMSKFLLGIPAAMLINAKDLYRKATTFNVKSARAYTLSSELVEPGSVKFLENTYNKINTEYKKIHGKDLAVGTDLSEEELGLIIHRDPALSDGSSMGVYKFAGVMALDVESDTKDGIVVNPKDQLWLEAAGDFDGDSGVAIIPDELTQPIATVKSAKNIDLMRKGGQANTSHNQPTSLMAHRRLLAAGNLTDEQRAQLIETDPLNAAYKEKEAWFSQTIGTIMATAQTIREHGLDDLTVNMSEFDAKGNPTGESISTPVLIALAKVGQASISAKKKAIWSADAQEALADVQKLVWRNAPIMRTPALNAAGEIVWRAEEITRDDGKSYSPKRWVRERAFSSGFRGIYKAPVRPTDANPNSKEVVHANVVLQANHVMHQLLAGRLQSKNKNYTGELVVGLADLRTALAAHGVPNAYTMSDNALVVAWSETDVTAPVSLQKYLSTLVDTIRGRGLAGVPLEVRRLATSRQLSTELAFRTLAQAEVIETLGVLNDRKRLPNVFKAGAALLLGDVDTEGVKLATHINKQYQVLAQQLDVVDENEDPDSYADLMDRRQELVGQLEILHYADKISGLEMIYAAPPALAVKIVDSDVWKEASEALKNAVDRPITMVVNGLEASGKAVDPSTIKDGVFYYHKNSETFYRVNGIRDGKPVVDSDSVPIKRSPAPSISAEDDLARIDINSFVEARLTNTDSAGNGYVHVKIPPGWAPNANAKSLALQFRALRADNDSVGPDSYKDVGNSYVERVEETGVESRTYAALKTQNQDHPQLGRLATNGRPGDEIQFVPRLAYNVPKRGDPEEYKWYTRAKADLPGDPALISQKIADTRLYFYIKNVAAVESEPLKTRITAVLLASGQAGDMSVRQKANEEYAARYTVRTGPAPAPAPAPTTSPNTQGPDTTATGFTDEAGAAEEKEEDMTGRERFVTTSGKVAYLSRDQTEALNEALLMREPSHEKKWFRINGSAGTGKSTMVRELLRRWRYMYGGMRDRDPDTRKMIDRSVALASPTHRANAVLRSMSGYKMSGRLTDIIHSKVDTLDSLVGGAPSHDGSGFAYPDVRAVLAPGSTLKQPPIAQMRPGQVLIIDEISMMDNSLLKSLTDWQDALGFSVIELGDIKQLPPVGLKASPAFLQQMKEVTLNTVMRQRGSSPLLDFLTDLRKNKVSIKDLKTKYNEKSGEGVIVVNDVDLAVDRIAKMFSKDIMTANKNQLRIVTPTNASVRKWNDALHAAVFPDSVRPVEQGEAVVGYENSPSKTGIRNGVDYVATRVGPDEVWKELPEKPWFEDSGLRDILENWNKLLTTELKGNRVTISEGGKGDIEIELRVVARDSLEAYGKMMLELEKLRVRVSNYISQSYRSGTQVNSNWPIYLNWQKDIKKLQTRVVSLSAIGPDGTPVDDRAEGRKPKPLVKRALDLGYASTVHKAQGGTVNIAVVDKDTLVNWPTESEIEGLLYTGLSRASKTAIVIDTSETKDSISELDQLVSTATKPEFYQVVEPEYVPENEREHGEGINATIPFPGDETAEPVYHKKIVRDFNMTGHVQNLATRISSAYDKLSKEDQEAITGSLKQIYDTKMLATGWDQWMNPAGDLVNLYTRMEPAITKALGEDSNANTISRKTKITYATDDEALASLEPNHKRAKLQNAAESVFALMGTKSPVKVITAKQMYDRLMEIGGAKNEKIAQQILNYAYGNGKAGANGAVLTDEDGSRYIYIAGDAKTLARDQVGILTHELGHAIIDDNFAALEANSPETAEKIRKDYKKWVDGSKSIKNKKATKESNDSFVEWLADNIGMWLLTDDHAKSVTDAWYKRMAARFIRHWKQFGKAIRRLFSDGQGNPQILESVSDWLKSIAKTEEQILRAYGPAVKGQSVADRIVQRRNRMKLWQTTGQADWATLESMIPSVKEDLDGLIGAKNARLLREAAFTPGMKNRLMQLVGSNSDVAREISTSVDSAAAYFYVLSTMGIMRSTPEITGIMHDVTEGLRFKNRQTLEATPDEINEMVRNLNLSGEALADPKKDIIPTDSPAARLYKERSQRFAKGAMGAAQRTSGTYKKIFGWYIDEPYQRLLESGVPSLIEAARLIQPMAYEIGNMSPAGMLERQRVRYQMFTQYKNQILKDLDADDMAQLQKVLYLTPGIKKNAKVAKAEGQLRKLLNDLYAYETDGTSTKIAFRENYFPMVTDKVIMEDNMPGVLDIYANPEFTEGWRGVADDYIKWIEKELKTQPDPIVNTQAGMIDAMWNSDPTGRTFIEFYLRNDGRRMLPGTAIRQMEIGKVHTPSFRFANPRELDFLLDAGRKSNGKMTAARRAELKDLHEAVVSTLAKNPSEVMDRYVRNATKRTEHEHLLKDLGPDGIEGLMETAAKRDGATPQDLGLFMDYITAVQGMLGLRERDVVDGWLEKLPRESKIRQKYHSQKAAVMNPELQNRQQWVMAWENISHLTLAFASATVDPFGQMAKHGDFGIFLDSIKDTRALMAKQARDPSTREMYVDFLGTLEHSMKRQDIDATYAADNMASGPAKLTDAFFKANQVERITDWSRSMATFAGMASVKKWAADSQLEGLKGELARKRLADFDLTPEDVALDEEGNTKVLSYEEVGAADQEERARDFRVRVAIHRFVDQSTVRPDPTSRALVMSNPYYALPMMWKAYSITFNANVLRPAWARAIEEGNASPVLWLALTTIPMMLFADMLRDAIKMSLSDDEDEGEKLWRPRWKRDWTLTDHVLYAIERAGFYENHELTNDIIQPLLEGKVPQAMTELGGVVSSDARKVSDWGMDNFPMPLGDLTSSW